MGLAFAAGCGAANNSESRPQQLDVLRPLPGERVAPAVDLTGSWMTGRENEPDAREVVLRPQCNYSPRTWIIDQTGDTLRAREIPERFAQGVPTPPVQMEAAVGRISGVDARLEMSGLRYVLRYDSTSGHLRGTLNGAPFWAARQKIIQPPGCIPPP